MKKLILLITITFYYFGLASAENNDLTIYEGSVDAKVVIKVYESLTCGHCADFHKNVYPELKKNFIDTGLIKIEFRNFPLDIASLNASKIAHCRNDGNPDILHLLYDKQSDWIKGEKIDDLNLNLKKIIDDENIKINFDKCLKDKFLEEHILEDRIAGVTQFKVNATPTIIINKKKFDKPLTYKNLKKAIEKLI